MKRVRFAMSLRHPRWLRMGLAALLLGWMSGIARGESPVFDTEVMAVLSRSGCNAGLCHGNQNGKGGFRLSLRGQDAEQDYQSLAREQMQRRVNRLAPRQSLLLLKPTGQVAHEGGVRFRQDSPSYRILRDWIAAGAARQQDAPTVTSLEVSPREAYLPGGVDELQLTVTAKFSDGAQRDVTDWAVYEVSNTQASVTPGGRVQRAADGEATVVVRYLQQQAPVRVAFLPGTEFHWQGPPPRNEIDQAVFAKLRRLQLHPSPICDDGVFVRRVYLDLLGIPPTGQQARRFVTSDRAEKRSELIDELLSRPELAEHWALKWSDLLRNEEKVLDVTGVERFHGWIRDSLAQDKPWNHFVRELLVGQGSTYENPPANYYRALREPLERAETTARLFLGYRLQCARCHNHPFDRWSQDDYYSWAALFARIDYKIVDNKRKDKFDKHEFVGEQIVQFKDQGEVKNARTGKDAQPRFLADEALPLNSSDHRLEQLADWVTSGDNRQFARSMANLVWFHTMGRGVVEPVDDFRVTNPPVNPELLELLADRFVQGGFRLRPLLRTILNSHTYQASSRPNETNEGDQTNFSHAVVRRLPAEQLLDAQCQFLQLPAQFAGREPGIRAGQLPGVQRAGRRAAAASGDRFLSMFGKPQRLLACACERSNETTLSQVFLLVSGAGINERLAEPGGRVHRLAHSDLTDEQIVEELYWESLCRPPSEAERAAVLAHVRQADDRFSALQDVAWALLNSKEFVFRR